jgi:hypothetical protein
MEGWGECCLLHRTLLVFVAQCVYSRLLSFPFPLLAPTTLPASVFHLVSLFRFFFCGKCQS